MDVDCRKGRAALFASCEGTALFAYVGKVILFGVPERDGARP